MRNLRTINPVILITEEHDPACIHYWVKQKVVIRNISRKFHDITNAKEYDFV